MIKIGDQDFEVLTEYLKRNFGINLTKKRTLIEGRLNNYLMQSGFSDYKSYLNMLFQDTTGNEINKILNYLTTNYSYFMREWNHFEYYKNHILPEVRQKAGNRDLRVWSAGCSTGEEAYMLAIITDEFFGEERTVWDKKILATDISEKVLAKAKEGSYEEAALEKMPNTWKMRYMNKTGKETWQMNDYMRREVIFRRFNLMEPVFPFKRKFHVIFCRNVMIYFDAETKQNLIQKFYERTEEGGYLIIGQSESIDRAASQYKYIMPSIYQKVGGNA